MAIPIETNVYRVQKSIPPKNAPSAETIAPMITSIALLLSDNDMTAIIDNIVPQFDKNAYLFLLTLVVRCRRFLRICIQMKNPGAGEKENDMNKQEKLLKAFTEIDNAVEISQATLAMMLEDLEEDGTSWVLLGVSQQLGKIREANNLIDEVIAAGKAVMA